MADRVRGETGAHVMLIHHSGKDTSKGARGHSLLRAAVDTELEVTRSGQEIAVTTRKQRSLGGDTVYGFQMKVLRIGTNDKGEPIASCYLVPSDHSGTQPEKRSRLTDKQRAAYDAVVKAITLHGQKIQPERDMPIVTGIPRTVARTMFDHEGLLEAHGTDQAKRRAFSEPLTALKAKGFLGVNKQYVWLPKKTHD